MPSSANSSDNNWPTYHLSTHRDHIHAIGVIAVAYSAYEGSLFRLYAHHAQIFRKCAGRWPSSITRPSMTNGA
jgi:hypothetical protein